MSRKVILTEESKAESAGKWVVRASTSGKFLAAGETLAEALKKSSSSKEKKSVSKVIPQIYAGACL